jgi:hypothetical protein
VLLQIARERAAFDLVGHGSTFSITLPIEAKLDKGLP